MVQLDDIQTKQNERMFALSEMFYAEGYLFYQGMPKIKILFYFSINKYKKNLD